MSLPLTKQHILAVPTYTNPAGSPAVNFNGRIQYTQNELAAACRTFGPQLDVPSGIDGARAE